MLTFWLPIQILESYRALPSLDPELVDARCGMSSSDNSRFYKLWWEVRAEDISGDKKWAFLSNGGSPTPLFRQQLYLVNYEDNGIEVKTRVKDLFGSASRTIINQQYYFRPGFTYGKRTESLTVQFLPKGHVFSNEGQAIFPINSDKMWHVLAYLNTSLVAWLLNSIAGQHKEAGYVGTLPAPHKRFLDTEWVKTQTRENYAILAKLAQAIPESQSFAWPLIWASTEQQDVFRQAARALLNESEVFSHRFIEVDNLLESVLGFPSEATLPWPHRLWDISNILYEVTSDEVKRIIAIDFLGYAIGTTLGRWDLRYATGEKLAPDLPDPFAPLPACPPGMLQNAEGLPAVFAEVPASYPLRISWPGILVDDEGHREDVEGRVREAIQVIWGERAEVIEQEACEILGVRALREYFRKPTLFFANHLSRYSKSRRQAPIYWPLSTRSGDYTLWLYYHRFTDQTLYSCVNDFVEPKLAQVRDELGRLRQKSGRTRADEQELERLTDLEQELQDFRAELLRVAAFWKPNLNDGVQINAAPLWKLFAHKPWQKKLKETWEKLEAGEYDWAHLSYSIWPERVRAKCKTDKSLAIAHDLEAVYVEPPAGAKKGRGKKLAVEAEEMFGEE